MASCLSRLFVTALVALVVLSLAACGARTRLRGPVTDVVLPDAPLDADADVPPDASDALVTFDVVDPCSRLGVTETGCAFPDGTRIPFGDTTTHGCIRCNCSESGALFCTDVCGAPEDDAGPFMARRCLMPDGQRVTSPSWALVGSVWCYCDSGGGASCRLPQCTDGGGVVSPPPILGPSTNCNTLSLTDALGNSTPPSVTRAVGTIPPATSGEIASGTYRLVSVTSFGSALPAARTSAVLSVEGTQVQIARYTANGAAIERASFDIEFDASGVVWWETCPQSTRPRMVPLPDGGSMVTDTGHPYYPVYSATPDSLTLYDPDTRAILFTYLRM